MHIGVPEMRAENGQITWSVAVDGLPDAPERLWFTLPEAHGGLLTERADPAVIGLIGPAMHAGESVTVAGSVTDELAHSMTHGYQHILEAVIPGLQRVPLEIAYPVPATNPAPGVGTGFSGGIDSFTVLAEHYFSPVAHDLRLTHLTLFNVGAMQPGERGRRHFHRVHSRLAPAAERLGLPYVAVDSNLDDFYRFADFLQTHGPRNLAAASLLQGGLGQFYFASSVPFEAVAVQRSNSTAYSDPISMPLLTTRQFRPVFHGSQYTRVEKTAIVALIPESHESLHVCTTLTADGRNCSRCNKCLRTELTLDITGQLDVYHRAFDLDVYRAARRAYLDEVAWSRDVYAAEIRALAHRTGFPLPSAGAGFLRYGLGRAGRKAGTLRRRSAGSRLRG
ncbi:hypothetical protein [Microbacterium sp.]|uniref:hypothetical protein n=1 Tax=Microbacterium sp. TaxID=51671 RepID=UPI0028117596|nr:hypothetical protein [Microbacterium sp.]